jgi:hypothetical protein
MTWSSVRSRAGAGIGDAGDAGDAGGAGADGGGSGEGIEGGDGTAAGGEAIGATGAGRAMVPVSPPAVRAASTALVCLPASSAWSLVSNLPCRIAAIMVRCWWSIIVTMSFSSLPSERSSA